MIKKILEIYKRKLFNRCDDNGAIFYFSHTDYRDLNAEDYEFTSSKGYKLKGKFYFYDKHKHNHIIIFEHGMGGGHLSYFKEIELLAKKGFKVFAYDHSGCMESEGPSTGGFCQSLCDLNDCLNALKNDPNFKKCDFSVIGHSWGAFSTLNIAKYHNDIKHIIAISGFISLKQMLSQMFGSFFKKTQVEIYNLEKESNPEFVDCDATESLNDYKGKCLIIHSIDDKTVKAKFHFNPLYEKFNSKENFHFLLTQNKNHNPNYTEEAVIYKDKFFKEYVKVLKKGLLNTTEQKENFKIKFNWQKMTQQDPLVWKEIFKILEK